jgi:hypothetical protein
MPKKVKYISGLPGIGKTEWAVRRMVEVLKSEEGLVLYVAPTTRLLREVHERLATECPERIKHIRKFYTESVGAGQVGSSFVSALRGKRNSNGRKIKEIKEGSILLMTHQGFMSVHTIPRSEELELIFDESRKCIARGKELKFYTPEQRQALEQCLDINTSEANSTFHRITARPGASTKFAELSKQLEFNGKQRSAVQSLIDMAGNPRVEAYLKYRGSKDSEKSSLRMFEVILPSRIFEGFKDVTLLSAFFEESQMYHLLTQNGVNLKNITAEVPDLELRMPKILRRYSSVTLVPLTPQQRALTMSNQDNMMLDQERPELRQRLRDLELTTSAQFKNLKVYYRDPDQDEIPARYRKAITSLKEHANHVVINPMEWLLKRSQAIINKWVVDNPIDKKPLLVLNKRTKKMIEDETGRTLLGNFETMTTSVHGLNEYAEHDVVVFLAAVNPSPDLIKFFRIILEKYQFEKDHIADVCVQCVCRSSVRDTSSKTKVLVIVPDMKIADLLRERLADRVSMPSELRPKRNMAFLDRDFGLHTVGRMPLTSTERVNKLRVLPYGKDIRNLNQRIKRLKDSIISRVSENKSASKYSEKMRALAEQLQEFKDKQKERA